VTGLEIQPDLVAIARKNIALNDYHHQFQVKEGEGADINTVFQPEMFSLVITNPPFYMNNSGRLNKNLEALTARHQQGNSLSEFVQAAAYCLKNRGRFVIIYPAGSLPSLFHELNGKKLAPKRARFIYSYPQNKAEAKLVLVEALKNGGSGMRFEQPLYIYDHKNGPYTDEIVKMYDTGMVNG
ncbi:MAG: N-6 DNA methylase, partial [Desulfocapsaceae bacterium]|nr:N-6 DNA methylase [Desulfocapsaceae bacterium]